MRRVLKIVRGFFGLLAISGILILWAASIKSGREAVVWSFANLFPGSARLTVGGIAYTLSAPIGWIEGATGARFGGRVSLYEAVDCMGDRTDRSKVQSCIRDRERFIPMPPEGYNMTMFWKDDKPCTVQLSEVTYDRYVPTLLAVELRVEASAKRLFAAALSENLRPDTLHSYRLDADGCDFLKRNEDAYEWGVLYMKGFANDLEQATP